MDLPSEWRLCVTGNGEQIRYDKGNIYSSRKDAIDAMIRNNSSPSDIFKLWNTLHVEGWLEDVNLPTGWKRKYLPRSAAHYFLSPLMEVFRSKR